MLRGLLNVGVPLGTEARAGVSDTADATTKINPTTSGAVLRTSNPVIRPPSSQRLRSAESLRSAKSTTMKAASRAFVADDGPLAIITIHENRPGTPPSPSGSTDQTGAHRRASARARARPAIPRRGRVRQRIRRAADVAAPAPHDRHDAPDGRRLAAHVVAVRGVRGALAGLQRRPSGLAGDDLRRALDRGGGGGHRGGARLPLAFRRPSDTVSNDGVSGYACRRSSCRGGRRWSQSRESLI